MLKSRIILILSRFMIFLNRDLPVNVLKFTVRKIKLQAQNRDARELLILS